VQCYKHTYLIGSDPSEPQKASHQRRIFVNRVSSAFVDNTDRDSNRVTMEWNPNVPPKDVMVRHPREDLGSSFGRETCSELVMVGCCTVRLM
jgi:hypothetical protein